LPARHRAPGDPFALLEAGLVVPLDDGYELDEIGARFIPQEAIHLQRADCVGRVDGGQDVELDAVFLQQCQPGHHAVERRPASPVDAVGIVQLAWAIQAEADQEAVLPEEAAPFVVQERAIRLQRVANHHAGPPVRLL
jgi:hypothetical protein